MLPRAKTPLHFPRWVEWLLAFVMLFTALLEFAHQQYFWTTFFTLAALLVTLSAARLFGKSKDDPDTE